MYPLWAIISLCFILVATNYIDYTALVFTLIILKFALSFLSFLYNKCLIERASPSNAFTRYPQASFTIPQQMQNPISFPQHNRRLPTHTWSSSFLVLCWGLCLLRCLGRSRASPWSQGIPDVPLDHGGVPVARSQPPRQRRLMEPQVTRSPSGGARHWGSAWRFTSHEGCHTYLSFPFSPVSLIHISFIVVIVSIIVISGLSFYLSLLPLILSFLL